MISLLLATALSVPVSLCRPTAPDECVQAHVTVDSELAGFTEISYKLKLVAASEEDVFIGSGRIAAEKLKAEEPAPAKAFAKAARLAWIRQTEAQAETEPRKNISQVSKKKRGPARKRGSRQSMAQAAGVSEKTVRNLESHVATAEAFP